MIRRPPRSTLQNIKNIKKAVEAKKRKQEEREREREREQPTASTSNAQPATPATPCTSHNTTAHLSSAKKRKLEVGKTAADIVPINDENIILKQSYLRELFTNVACSQCYGQSLKVQFVKKSLDFKLHLKCEDCGNECGDGKVDDTPITNTLVYSTMEVGLGFTSYNKLISNMSMTPLYAKYQDTQRHILQKTEQKAKEVMERPGML
ncbi:hypothetical protein GWK47_002673 [Chionoecetes opilio]|uniref:Uncharacterized protein n=1 Tax=Chionoecetes opilio TaxID=41210 RepID=A0A8J4XLY8_CHIOP|nr:hypothetical protein GWK47_002673 [Chionoecetes opilio]